MEKPYDEYYEFSLTADRCPILDIEIDNFYEENIKENKCLS